MENKFGTNSQWKVKWQKRHLLVVPFSANVHSSTSLAACSCWTWRVETQSSLTSGPPFPTLPVHILRRGSAARSTSDVSIPLVSFPWLLTLPRVVSSPWIFLIWVSRFHCSAWLFSWSTIPWRQRKSCSSFRVSGTAKKKMKKMKTNLKNQKWCFRCEVQLTISICECVSTIVC